MFENEMNTNMNTEVKTEEVETKKRGRTAKPAISLSDAFAKFDNGEIKAFSAEYRKGEKGNSNKLKCLFINVDGVPTAMAPADAGKEFSNQDYATLRDRLNIISSVSKVSVNII